MFSLEWMDSTDLILHFGHKHKFFDIYFQPKKDTIV